MEKKRHIRLLVDFFDEKYYRAYDDMIYRLHEARLIPYQKPRLIERLEFYPNLPRGSKAKIYFHLARLLQSGSSVLKRHYTKNDLYRWLANPEHCNLGANFQTIKSGVNKVVTTYFKAV